MQTIALIGYGEVGRILAEDLRARGLAVDLLAAHAHMGLVYEGRVVARLEREGLAAARAGGHTS